MRGNIVGKYYEILRGIPNCICLSIIPSNDSMRGARIMMPVSFGALSCVCDRLLGCAEIDWSERKNDSSISRFGILFRWCMNP